MTSPSIYQSLDVGSEEIRLFHLQGTCDEGETIIGQLETVSLLSDPQPQYETVSYCWGEVDGLEQITINGQTCSVPGSSAKVLKQFRQGEHSRTLWIDALCINQEDVSERGHQVMLMGRIYRSGFRNCIWLGDADDQTEQTFQAIKKIASLEDSWGEFEPEFRSTLLAESLMRLMRFVERPWFRRVWVVQEAALSPLSICRCGPFEVTWREMYTCYALAFLTDSQPDEMRTFEWSQKTDIGLKTVITGRTIRQVATGLEKVPEVRLITLLGTARLLEATDVRDKIYGMLGLAEWSPLVRNGPGLPKWLAADYSKPISAVVRDITRASIIETGTLWALEHAGDEALESRLCNGEDFVSWTPRWDKEPEGPRHWNIRCHCADRAMDLSLLEDYTQPDSLFIQGYVGNRISKILPRLAASDSPGSPSEADTEQFFSDCARFLAEAGAEEAITSLPDVMTLGLPLGDDYSEDPISLHLVINHDPSLNRWSLQTDEENRQHLKQFYSEVRKAARGRRLFLTSIGMLGIAPEGVQAGDWFALLLGGKPLFILRPINPSTPSPHGDEKKATESEQTPPFQLIGTCYIHNLMNDSLIRGLEGRHMPPQVIELR